MKIEGDLEEILTSILKVNGSCRGVRHRRSLPLEAKEQKQTQNKKRSRKPIRA